MARGTQLWIGTAGTLALTAALWATGCVTPGPAAPRGTATGAASRDEARAALVELRGALRRGKAARDAPALLAAREALLALTAREDLAAAAFYWVAYADFVLGTLCDPDVPGDAARARELADHGVAHVKAALERAPERAEAHALLATLLGLRMQHSGVAALGYAGRAASAMRRALELEPDNPRVVLQHAVRLVNLPGFLGGDRARGLERLDEAEALYARWTPPDDTAPDWGRVEVAVWRGVALRDAGDLAGAERAFEAALALEPGYVLVRDVLLPDLRERRAAAPPR